MQQAFENAVRVLERLAEKVERAKQIVRSGGTLTEEDFVELFTTGDEAKAIANEAKALSSSDEHDQHKCMPAVVVQMDGGAIHCVISTNPVRLVMLDFDTEGGDPENIRTVNGEKSYLHDYTLSTPAEYGGDGIDANYVREVLDQV